MLAQDILPNPWSWSDDGLKSGRYDAARVVAINTRLEALLLRSGVLLGRFSLAALREFFDSPWSGCLGGGLEEVGRATQVRLAPSDVHAVIEATEEAVSLPPPPTKPRWKR